jgi:hypothetical protein
VTAASGSLSGAATSVSDLRRRNCDSVVLREFACGDERGLLLAVLTGNYKDDGTAVASSIGAVALADAFNEPLLSEADIVPALRRAAIHANDDILRVSKAPVGAYAFGTVMGSRSTMTGIGASMTAVAALPTPARLHLCQTTRRLPDG